MKGAEVRDHIIFDRLQYAHDPKKAASRVANRLPQNETVVSSYVPEGFPIPESRRDSGADMGYIFKRKLLFEIERLPITPELEIITTGLQQKSRVAEAKALNKLREFVSTHPEYLKGTSGLRMVAELPPNFGFYLQGGLSYGASITKGGAKKMNTELPGMEVKPPYVSRRISPTDYVTLHLAAGNLYPTKRLKELPRKSNGSERIDGMTDAPLDLPRVIRMYKVAREVYGEAWKKQVTEELRAMVKNISRLEWETPEQNPMWKDEEERHVYQEIKKREAALRHIALEPSDKSLSWHFFIKKLHENEDELKARWLEAYDWEKATDDADMQEYLQDIFAAGEAVRARPLAHALTEIGKRLAQVAPEGTVGRKDRAVIAADFILKYGLPREPEMQKLLIQGVREIQWDRVIAPFKELIRKKTEQSNLFEQASGLAEGYFRDFFLHEAWKKEPQKDRATAERYLERMQKEVPDGAKANRSGDLMGQYVKAHIAEGTENENRFQLKFFIELRQERGNPYNDIAPTQEEADQMSEEQITEELGKSWVHNIGSYDRDKKRLSADHRKRKQALREQAKDFHSPRDLFVFSDIARKRQDQEIAVEKSYAMRLVAEVANRDIRAIGEKASRGEPIGRDIKQARAWIEKYLPETCLLRDFYLENLLNLAMHEHVKTARVSDHVKLEQVDVDLNEHYQGKDDGVLEEAYFTRYSLYRVRGLQQQVRNLSSAERVQIAEVIKDWAPSMSPGAAEMYERIAVELEEKELRAMYERAYHDALPRGRTPSEADDRAARDLAFHRMLESITKRFPLASYYRDELLNRFALDYARTPEQLKEVQEATYAFLMRRPQLEEKRGEKSVFGPAESVKNYLALFQDRASRAKILGWIFGGEMPDDRYLEARAFKVNADEEREVFWLMSAPERKAVLYSALMGEHGLFEVRTDWPQGYSDKDIAEERLGNNEAQFMRFLMTFYEENFAQILSKEEGEKSMEPALRSMFFEIFKQYSIPRRVELFLAITERMRDLKLRDEKLTAGQAIRLFLEQVGVVGIKAGQVISEQKGMVSDDVKAELSSLRDRAAPFAKFGVFTYLRLAKFFGEQGRGETPFQISQVGECLGSASIKQAHLARTETGEEVVVKVPRPTIDKNYAEDVLVLEKVMERLRQEKFTVPEYLLHEIVDACAIEFDFSHEGLAQREMDHIFRERNAQVVLEAGGKSESVRFEVPNLEYLLRRGDSNVADLQLMMDEYIAGFTLSEIEDWQNLGSKSDLTDKEHARKEELQAKLRGIYREYASLVGHEYEIVSVQGIRSQIALDLLEQITSDGIFHADLHSGNAIVDLHPKAKRVALIDFGSVGRSVEVRPEGTIDHRAEFREFLSHLMFLKRGGSTRRLGETIAQYVRFEGLDGFEPFTAERWAETVERLDRENETLEGFFKALLSEIIGTKAKIDRQFKFLLKSLAAAGGHLDALRTRIESVEHEARSQGRPVLEALGAIPGIQKLVPLAAANPAARAALGM